MLIFIVFRINTAHDGIGNYIGNLSPVAEEEQVYQTSLDAYNEYQVNSEEDHQKGHEVTFKDSDYEIPVDFPTETEADIMRMEYDNVNSSEQVLHSQAFLEEGTAQESKWIILFFFIFETWI